MTFSRNDADRISDRVVDLLNEEIKERGVRPLPLLAGLLMGLAAYLRTAPQDARPHSFNMLEDAVYDVLREVEGALKTL